MIKTIKESDVIVDQERDIVVIYGIRYSGALFRGLGIKTEPGWWMQVTAVEDGIVTLYTESEESIISRTVEGG